MKIVLACLLLSTLAHANEPPITEQQYAQVMDRMASKIESKAREEDKRPLTSRLDLAAALRLVGPEHSNLARDSLAELHISAEQVAAFVRTHPDSAASRQLVERAKRAVAGLVSRANALPKIDDIEGAASRAMRTHKPLFVFFKAEWCQPCKELMNRILDSPKILDTLHGYEVAVVDITDENESARATQAKYKANTLPLLLVLKDGKEVVRLDKLVSADELSAALAR